MIKSKIIWGLLLANVALGFSLVLPYVRQQSAMAQRIERPADYLLIPGNISGADRGVVYILDTSNGLMSAVAYDDSTGRIEVMQPVDLIRVFEEGVAGNNRKPKR